MVEIRRATSVARPPRARYSQNMVRDHHDHDNHSHLSDIELRGDYTDKEPTGDTGFVVFIARRLTAT